MPCHSCVSSSPGLFQHKRESCFLPTEAGSPQYGVFLSGFPLLRERHPSSGFGCTSAGLSMARGEANGFLGLQRYTKGNLGNIRRIRVFWSFFRGEVSYGKDDGSDWHD